MRIERTLKKVIEKRLYSGKALVINGPRQVGKTTLIKDIVQNSGKTFEFINGDDPVVRKTFDTPNTEQLRQILGTTEIIFIDEAQRIPNIRLTSKIITDEFSTKQLILSGSSSFELASQMQEPLTGRKWTFELFPISWQEHQNHMGYLKSEQDLENRLVYGFYPDVLNNPTDQPAVLKELVDSYLYKDVLTYSGIRKPEVVQKLVQALAHQVGNEVSYREVGALIGLDPKTVDTYINVLEKAYVLFRLPSYSRNLRNEIKTNSKIYFYDNGVRNAIIGALQPIAARQDVGALWENFLVSERLKYLRYNKIQTGSYFWRTKQLQEVELVEERDGKIYGFEFKWNPKRKIRFPKTFTETYNAEVQGITRENFRDFVM